MNFSIVIPTYNRLEFLKKCLAAALSLSYDHDLYEVLVVDDGSSDGTGEYLRSVEATNLRVFRQPHAGPAKARNLAIAHSRGEFVAFTDDDCLVPANWLGVLEVGLKKWPKAGAVGGYLEAPETVLAVKVLSRLEAYETREVYKAGDKEYLGDFESPAGGTNNIAYRAEVLRLLGGFDEDFPVPAGEDADLKKRAVAAGFQIGYLPLKVTHLDPYSLKSFLRRAYVSGIGASYFDQKHRKKVASIKEILISLLRDLASMLRAVIGYFSHRASSPPLSIKLLVLLRSVVIGLGKIGYWRRAKI